MVGIPPTMDMLEPDGRRLPMVQRRNDQNIMREPFSDKWRVGTLKRFVRAWARRWSLRLAVVARVSLFFSFGNGGSDHPRWHFILGLTPRDLDPAARLDRAVFD